MGDSRILAEAETFLSSEILGDLRKIAEHISNRYPTVHTFFDLSEFGRTILSRTKIIHFFYMTNFYSFFFQKFRLSSGLRKPSHPSLVTWQ
jgi:hypothetical protein